MDHVELGRALEFVRVGACYVCGADENRLEFDRVFFGRPFTWVRCARCGLVYQQPKLSRASLDRIYNSTLYWAFATGDDGTARLGYSDYVAHEAFRLRQGRARLAIVERFLRPPARLLDVACASGFFTRVACDAGFDAKGIDLSKTMAEFGRRTYGVEIQVGDFEQLEAPRGALDGITIWGSDSNFFDPRETFTRANALLRDGGFVFFNFWDFDHPARALLGEFKMTYNALCYFNRQSVRQLLEATGFQVRALSMEWQSATLDAIFEMTSRPRLRRLAARLGLGEVIVRLPTISGYVVAAEKRSAGSG